MSRFNNVQTTDGYSPAATIENVPNGVQVSLHVFNEAIVYQLATGYPGGSWGAERYLAPGFHVLARRASGVRVRSAVSGQPAQVTAEVASEEEVSWGETPPGDFHGNHTLTVDAAGNPTYDFDGHVSAQGLDLEAHDAFGTEPLPHSTIRWLREADDVAIARMHGLHGLTDDTGVLVLDALGAGDARASLALLAVESPGDLAAELSLEHATIGPLNRVLLDELEQSSFVQVQEGGARRWFLQVATVVFNMPSVGANSSSTLDITGWLDLDGSTPLAPEVGDLILTVEPTVIAGGLAKVRHTPRCQSAGQITYVVRNHTGSAIDDVSRVFVAAWIRGAALP